jgi:hypothetical protein
MGPVRFAAQKRWYTGRSVLPVCALRETLNPKLFPAFSVYTAVVFRSADSCSEERSQLFLPNPCPPVHVHRYTKHFFYRISK